VVAVVWMWGFPELRRFHLNVPDRAARSS